MTAQKAKNDSATKLPIKPHGVLCAPSTREREFKKKKKEEEKQQKRRVQQQRITYERKKKKKTHFEQCDTRTESQKEKSKR